MTAFCLSMHTGYRCAHSGFCCTAGWPIPIEAEQVEALRERGVIPLNDAAYPVILHQAHPEPASIVGTKHDGACVFHDGRLCVIHRDAGPALLPAACRNFPRVALRDPRGLFVTLSHFCPTAAGLLLTAGDISIVEAPASISLDGEVEGLDATSVMPPLLRHGMLMDLEGYDTWERLGIAVLNDARYSARRALTIISAATDDACDWRPGRGTLSIRITRAFEDARSMHAAIEQPMPSSFERALKAFLAAHLFANWTAYQGSDLSAVVESLESILALVGGEFSNEQSFIEAVRAADLRLRHTGTDAGWVNLAAIERV
jgi:hypothetical protein